MSSEALRVVEQIQSILVGPDVVAALEDAETDRLFREAISPLVEPEFEVVMVGPNYLPSQQEAAGIDGFRERWRDWTSPFESFRVEVEAVLDAGDKVVSLVRQSGTTRTGGVEIETAGAAVWHVRSGRLRRVEFHLDRQTALKAAGLPPEDAQSSQA